MTTNGKTAVVTGASAGIGEFVAQELARQSYKVVMLGRNPMNSDAALARIRATVPGADVSMVVADLSVLAEADRAANEVLQQVDRIDLLINNAGGTVPEHRVTPDGLEATFAGNHLGPFVLTNKLIAAIRTNDDARIVNVSSVGHRMIKDMVWDDLQLTQAYDPNKAYFQSKLANILWTRELARRLAPLGITANAMHPGMVDSNFAGRSNAMTRIAYAVTKPFLRSVAKGAETVLWLATSPAAAGLTGGYYIDCKAARTSRAADSDEGARRLWQISEELAARKKATAQA